MASIRIAIFGEVCFSSAISRTHYRIRGLPTGFELVRLDGAGLTWLRNG